MMEITKTVEELQSALKGKADIVFVPTMGALHEGHISLVRKARTEGSIVVVSVFVNPTQFNDPTDLAKYPRTLEADAAMLAQAGADILFAPSVEQIYPKGAKSSTNVERPAYMALAEVMEGALRPGHFEGVVQVVGRLFDLVNPQKAIFGEKDFQQLAILRAMTAHQARPIKIIGHPIVRDADGLALSSRNALLGADERAAAPLIYKELCDLKAKIDKDQGSTIENLSKQAIANLENNRYLCPEYIEVVDPQTLRPTVDRRNFRICTAVRCGSVRLIDNI